MLAFFSAFPETNNNTGANTEVIKTNTVNIKKDTRIVNNSAVDDDEIMHTKEIIQPNDCGKELICTKRFYSHAGNQLSLKSGEKVILLKVGVKGWLFVRQIDTQR